MKLTKRQLLSIIKEELKNTDSIVNINIDNIVKEQSEELSEGLFSQALKTAAISMVPGGRIAADFTRARGFEQLEAASEAIEERLEALEQRLSSLETLLSGLSSSRMSA